ncbi:CDP-alcohol phosphatidyltransferase family protein [Phytoactinopolyspora limicola]|uniref:CDP-alcohol phosphatidyltransferase family protein n=1 Tax=Phytoactinopolyspora limicola TaxID=2715536 RepID=UPI0014077CE5|nr:CDP-alcohol phosphatidyltransferase family protein [Phytoactinopolyspora limicola]
MADLRRSTPPPPSAWNLANAVTVLRFLLVPVFGWLLLRSGGDDTASRVAAFVTFTLAMLSDRADGELARRRGIITDFGKIADPIADKALTGMAFVGLSILGELPWWVTGLVLAREWGITAMRFVVIRYGVMPAGRGGKVKTALQAVALGLYVLPLGAGFDPVLYVAMTLAVSVTLITGADYVLQALRLRRAASNGSSAG